jgi:predicted lipopolysaccharide heptosyltransferase III
MNRILVIKLRYIGDVLLATPVFRALKAAYPAAALTVAVNEGTEGVLLNNPDIDDVVLVRKESWWRQAQLLSALRRKKFDCVIDLTDGDRSAVMTWATGAPVRIGFNDEQRWRGGLYTTIIPKATNLIHRTARDLSALGPLRLQPASIALSLRIDGAAQAKADALLDSLGIGRDEWLVMLQPGARYWFKAWPLDRFARLGELLAERWKCRFLIGGAASEQQLGDQLRSMMRQPATVLAGKLSLPEYAAVLKRCRLFVGNDSGAMHMAAAVETPVVGLFGPSNPQEWGPVGDRVKVIYKGLDCRACFHPTCERGELNCMQQITVDETFAAAADLLGA